MPINLYSKDSVDDLLDAKLSDAPIDGSTYGRQDGAWAIVSGGGLTISDLSNAATATLNAGVPTAGQALTYDGTDLIWATVTGDYLPLVGGTVTGPVIVDESATSGFTTTYSGALISMAGGLMYISQEEGVIDGFNISLPASGTIGHIGTLIFQDASAQTTAGVSSDKAIANAFASSMWYAWDGYDYTRNGVVNSLYISGSYLSAGISDGTTFAAGFPSTNATLNTGNHWYVSINGTLSDLYIFIP